jgi:hypothetical protein
VERKVNISSRECRVPDRPSRREEIIVGVTDRDSQIITSALEVTCTAFYKNMSLMDSLGALIRSMTCSIHPSLDSTFLGSECGCIYGVSGLYFMLNRENQMQKKKRFSHAVAILKCCDYKVTNTSLWGFSKPYLRIRGVDIKNM